jgi:hypothetical protein
MKAWILLFLVLLGLVVSSMPGAGSLQITIVIPAKWGPYVTWLMDFPGWQPGLEDTPGGIRTTDEIATSYDIRTP